MKRFAILIAFLSFTLGLNATITKEDILNANREQFEAIKKELSSLNKEQTEKLKKVYMAKELRNALKEVFINKKLLKEASYAVIENGKIVKVSNQKDADGITFWHEHSSALENPPANNVCVIRNPTWENTNLDSPCGVIRYQLSPDSIYAQTNFDPPLVYLLPSYDETTFQTVLNLFPDEDTVSDTYPFLYMDDYAIHRYYDNYVPLGPNPDRLTQFLNNQVVTDIVASAGYTFHDDSTDFEVIVKPYGPALYARYSDHLASAYDTTGFSQDSHPIMTLKTGDYTYFLINYYQVGADWWDGYKIILKWIPLTVQNDYLDVGIDDIERQPAADIIWNNNQVSIKLDESVNPATTTYSLYDMAGRLIQRKKLDSHNTSIATPSAARGAYVVYLSGQNLSLSKKIVLSR